MPIRFNQDRLDTFDAVLPAITRFRVVFGRDLSPNFLAELYVARELNLELPDRPNEPGPDATDERGQKYEIKYRSPSTLNIDLNSFNFDQLILVNLAEDYHLIGMWRMPVEKAKAIFTFREKYHKYQATQAKVKREAIRIR